MAAGIGAGYGACMNTKPTFNRVKPADFPREEAPAPRPSHDKVSRRAKELWEKYGKPVGRDEEIWLEAERALRGSPITTPAETEGEDSRKLEKALEKIHTTDESTKGTRQLIR